MESLYNVTIPNNTDTETAGSGVTWLSVLGFIGLEVFSVPSFFANALVIATIWTEKDLRKEPTYMSMSVLAVSDMVHCIISMFPIAGSGLLQRRFPEDSKAHTILINMVFPAWYLTCLSYSTIAINRALVICRPDWNEKIMSRRNVLFWIGSWPFLVTLLTLPLITGECCVDVFHPLTWHLDYLGTDNQLNVQFCVCYTMSGMTTLISCICYPMAVLKVRRIKKEIQAAVNRKKNKRNADSRILLQFIALTVIFTFAWITLHFESQLIVLRKSGIFGYAANIGYAVMTTVNPTLYFSMNETLRTAAMALLRRIKDRVLKTCGTKNGMENGIGRRGMVWDLSQSSKPQIISRRTSQQQPNEAKI